MKNTLSIALLALLSGPVLGDPAAFALVSGRIYTADDWAPWAHAVVVRGERIVYVGEPGTIEWKRLVQPGTRIYDLGGRVMLPGIVDAHTHPQMVALSSWHTALPWTMNPDEQLKYLAGWAQAHPEQPVIYAEYYPTQMFGAAGPNRKLIDKYLPDRPVIWQDFSDHSSCLNSKALELMGITRDTPDPVPKLQYFVRDEKGEPTGWVKEGAYEKYLPKLFEAVHWAPPQQVKSAELAKVLKLLTDHGVDAVFDAWGSEDTFAAARELDGRGELQVYYEGSVVFESLAELPDKVAGLRAWQKRYGSRHVHLNTMKLFLDGTNEIATSAVLEPFASDPGKSGQLRLSLADLVEALLFLNREGVDIHIHMTGDRAFRTALDAVEEARRKAGASWRIQVTFAHCELIDDADFPRVAPLGVFVNWTPHWSGGYFQGPLETLGQARYDRMYRFQPIISTGGQMTFSSDCTTLYEWSRANPFVGIQIAHTRFDTDPHYKVYGVRKPVSEMLQVRDLVRGYTVTGARQLRLDHDLGSLAPGKLANFQVLDRNIFAIPAEEISETRSLAVFFEGKAIAGALPGAN